MNKRLQEVISGTEHDSIEDAIAADLVSSIPIVGAITDLLRLIESGEKPRKILQSIELLTAPLPLSDLFTPTNTLIYLDKKGILPVELSRLERLITKMRK